MHVNDLLKIAVERGASDLHLKVGSYPMMRVRGELTPGVQDKRLDHEEMVAIMAAAVLPTGRPREVQGQPRGRPRLQRGRPRAVPLQRVPAARHHRHDLPRHPDAGADASTSCCCRRC